MKRLLHLAVLILLTTCAAHAQNSWFSGVALGINPFVAPNPGGTPGPVYLSYAPVRVCNLPLTQQQPCLPLATVTDLFGNPLSVGGPANFGQLTTNVVGGYQFGCQPGQNIQIQVAPANSATPSLSFVATCPSGTGAISLNGNNIWTGPQTFTGLSTLTNMNGVIVCDGSKYPTLNAAVAAASSAILIPIGSVCPVTSNLSIPSGMTVTFLSSSAVSVSGGVTLTWNGVIQAAPNQQIFTGTGSVLVNSVSNSVYASWFAGSDVGAQIQNAMISCPNNCRIWLPDSAQSYSTPLNMAVGAANGIHLIGAGIGATVLTYTGSTSSPAFTTGCTSNAYAENFQITTANATGDIFDMCGNNNVLSHLLANGGGIGFHVTGSGSPSFLISFNQALDNLVATNNSVAEYEIDHAIDTSVSVATCYSATNNTTVVDFLVDSGVSGLNINNLRCGYGLNGFKMQMVQNSGGAPAAYNAAPLYVFINNAQMDTTTGGDTWKFDSTLGSNPVHVRCVDCWGAFAGMTNTSTVTTAGAVGWGVYGGDGIDFDSGKLRVNACSGVAINGANVNHWTVKNSTINANNQSNAAGCTGTGAGGDGIDVLSASPNGAVLDNTIGNVLDGNGHQPYGVKVAAVNADVLRIEDNNLANNATGCINNSNTGNTWIWGNTPMAGPCSNTVWGTILDGSQGGGQIFAWDSTGPAKTGSAAGCATAAAAGAVCTTTITWSAAFADTSYRPVCVGVGITSGVPLDGGITTVNAGSVVFQTVAGTAAAAQYANINCHAVHL